nr:hypothetical protein [Roseobacter litoralis]
MMPLVMHGMSVVMSLAARVIGIVMPLAARVIIIVMAQNRADQKSKITPRPSGLGIVHPIMDIKAQESVPP